MFRSCWMILLLLLISCYTVDPSLNNDQYINTWWCLQDNTLAFYMEESEPGKGPYFFNYYDTDPYFDTYIEGGIWKRINKDEFSFKYAGFSSVTEFKRVRRGCYEVSIAFGEDVACTCESMGYPWEE